MPWYILREAGKNIALDVCTRLASTVPSLQYVGMVWYTSTYVPLEGDRTIDSSIWYKVSARSGPAFDPTLVCLSEREGDVVYAELLASRGPA